MLPGFHKHCASLPDGLDLLFAHRWILLCFKREFPERGLFFCIDLPENSNSLMIDEGSLEYTPEKR